MKFILSGKIVKKLPHPRSHLGCISSG